MSLAHFLSTEWRTVHSGIRSGLESMEALVAHVGRAGADSVARAEAGRLIRYFDGTAASHQREEERNLFPRLMAMARSGRDTVTMTELHQFELDHAVLRERYAGVRRQLQAIVDGASEELAIESVGKFAWLCRRHMANEERLVELLAAMA